jgi:hypothetical protein
VRAPTWWWGVKLPFADASVTKAYTIDVLEHLSPEGLATVLREVSRVLAPGGSLFVYTHVRQRSVFAPVLRAIALTASTIERMGFADLTIEKLRKTDHLNPLMSRRHLDEVAAAAGFTVAKFRYYTPVLSSIAENILVPVAAHAMAGARRPQGSRLLGSAGLEPCPHLSPGSAGLQPCPHPGRSRGDARRTRSGEAAYRTAGRCVSRPPCDDGHDDARRHAARPHALGPFLCVAGETVNQNPELRNPEP